jgi:hypothetical protein
MQTSIPSNVRKSFIQRACSSPSIISLYQEPFIEPGTNADNSTSSINSPGNISKESPPVKHQAHKTTLQYNSNYSDVSSTSDLYNSNQDLNKNTNTNVESTMNCTAEISKDNNIKELAGEISKYYASVKDRNVKKENSNENEDDNKNGRSVILYNSTPSFTEDNERGSVERLSKYEEIAYHNNISNVLSESNRIKESVIERLYSDLDSSQYPMSSSDPVPKPNQAQHLSNSITSDGVSLVLGETPSEVMELLKC